jgi:ABC-type glycerol-3-phosphate transport system substrate-binding protein
VAVFVVLFALVGVLLLIRPSANEGIVIDIWHSYSTAEQELFTTLCGEYQADNPGVRINQRNIPFHQISTVIPISVESGTLPDVLRVDTPWQYYLEKRGALLHLDDWASRWSLREHVYPLALQEATVNGHLVGLPNGLFSSNILYNKALVRAAGLPDPKELDAAGKWDWPTFVDLLKKCTDPDKGVYGLGLRGSGSMFDFFPLLFASGGQVVQADFTVAINGDEAVEALERYVDLTRLGVTPPNVLGWGYQEVVDAFKGQRICMYPQGYWEHGNIAAEGLNIDCDYVPWPSIKGRQGSIVFTTMYVVSKESKHPDEAVKFAEWLTNPMNAHRWVSTLGLEPFDTITASAKDIADRSDLYAHRRTMAFARPGPAIPTWQVCNRALEKALQQALHGEKTPRECLDEAAQVVREEVQRTEHREE